MELIPFYLGAILYLYLLFFERKLWPMNKLDQWAKGELDNEEEMKTLFKRPGDVIIREGENSTDAYIILRGEVNVIKNKKIIATLKENSLFGEIGLVDQRPRTATCVAKTGCTLGTVTRENYTKLLEHRPKAVLPILRLVADRMRNLMSFVEGLAHVESSKEPNQDSEESTNK
tara:strand:+ start:438 stop:956 length:519 start_codon:yes stop_codon:yes gene_type:complete